MNEGDIITLVKERVLLKAMEIEHNDVDKAIALYNKLKAALGLP